MKLNHVQFYSRFPTSYTKVVSLHQHRRGWSILPQSCLCTFKKILGNTIVQEPQISCVALEEYLKPTIKYQVVFFSLFAMCPLQSFIIIQPIFSLKFWLKEDRQRGILNKSMLRILQLKHQDPQSNTPFQVCYSKYYIRESDLRFLWTPFYNNWTPTRRDEGLLVLGSTLLILGRSPLGWESGEDSTTILLKFLTKQSIGL